MGVKKGYDFQENAEKKVCNFLTGGGEDAYREAHGAWRRAQGEGRRRQGALRNAKGEGAG